MVEAEGDLTRGKEELFQSLSLTVGEIPIVTRDQFPGRRPRVVVPIHPTVIGLWVKYRHEESYALAASEGIWERAVGDVKSFINDPENHVGAREREKTIEQLDQGEEFWGLKIRRWHRHGWLVSVRSWRAFMVSSAPPVEVCSPGQVDFSMRRAQAYSYWPEDITETEEGFRFRAYTLFPTEETRHVIQAALFRRWGVAYQNLLLRVACGLKPTL